MGVEYYTEQDPIGGSLTAAGAPIVPPRAWFDNPALEEPTPLTVTADGRVFGHIAAWGTRHIGLPGKVTPPRSRSDYAFFKTGQIGTSDGDVNVGQLTLAGGHAPLSADAGAAVRHYDDTKSGVADINVGEDDHGIWVAGALRPDVADGQIRVLRASAPSGDWRPINGALELVAICQVNVPGFPVARARVASGAMVALVAAGAQDMYIRKMEMLSGPLSARVASIEAAVHEQSKQLLRNRVAGLRS